MHLDLLLGGALVALATPHVHAHIYPPQFNNYLCRSGEPDIPDDYDSPRPFDWQPFGQFSTGSLEHAHQVCRALDPYGYASDAAEDISFSYAQYTGWACDEEDARYPGFCAAPATLEAFLEAPPYVGYSRLRRRR